MDIQRDKEGDFRSIEKDINQLYAHYHKAYKHICTSAQLLAMVAFRFAQAHFELSAKVNSQVSALEDAEKALSRILLDVK